MNDYKKLNLEQAAAYLGVSPYTVRSWVRQRILTYYKLGRRLVFDPADLDRFLAERKVAPHDGPPGRPGRVTAEEW